MSAELPVAIIGAGPVGLAAAAHLVEQGIEPLVIEQGDCAGAAVLEWGHVRLFSAWSELIDAAAARLLEPTGWIRPTAVNYPTGSEWVAGYLAPLATRLGDRVRYRTRVVGVARRGRDRVVDAGREDQPFVVHTVDASSGEEVIEVRAVIDASGTWLTPNPLGGDGVAAIGEVKAADRISHRMPDLGDPEVRALYAGRHTVVVGSGHSAMTALVALVELAESDPTTSVTWAIRRGETDNVFGGGAADQLPARGALGMRAAQAVKSGLIEVETSFRVGEVRAGSKGRVSVLSDGQGDGQRRIDNVDQILALTGFRPDLEILSEVRLDLDERLSAPRQLAPLIDPNIHSCGTVPPHGVAELAQPEANLYVVGMKSYGRAPTFLALTGFEQVRSVVAAIAGDHESAANVELSLPESGVCGGSGMYDEDAAGGCCGAPAGPEEIQISPREMV